MVTRIAGAQVANYGGEHYPGLQQASDLLRDTITNIGARAQHWNDMQEFLAFAQFQGISEEIKGHFGALDSCLTMFSYATDVAQNQWIGEFSAVQRQELAALEQMRSMMERMNVSLDLLGQTQEAMTTMTTRMSEMLRKVLDDKSAILRNQETTTVVSYANAQQIVKTIMAVTNLPLPTHLLLGKQCILDGEVPIKSGVTCDIYSASFMGGEKVAKKVFRIGMSEKEQVERYAQDLLRDAQLWATFRSDYILPFYGIGMEAFGDDQHFQLYMISPLMKNLDAVTYLKQHKANPGMKEGIMRIITDAARGIQYLHNREPPVVHCDMRGDNILITDSGGAVLGGFSLTKALRSSTANDKIPPAVMTGKTESQRWMAPEMFAEDTPVLQTPSDVWGWAMAALELISGRTPYYHNTQPHTVMLDIQMNKQPRRAKHADFEKYALQPDQMWALLEWCWEVEPEARPTIDEVLVELKRINGRPIGTTPAQVKTEPRKTAADEIFECLMRHGCEDLTLSLNQSRELDSNTPAGGFDSVYRGRLMGQTTVAIKLLRADAIVEEVPPKGLERTMRELYKWSKTKHENVQPLMGVAMISGRLSIISPWMEHGNMRDYIQKHPDAERQNLCLQVAAGVDYIHSIHLVHGDLKACNILVSQDGVAKISDFDNSMFLLDRSLLFSATTGVGGTLRWMAPELLLYREDNPGPPVERTRQTDVYALGMTILEIITGKVPYYECRYDHAVVLALGRKRFPVRTKEFPISDEQANQIWLLMQRCWDHNSAARPTASFVHKSLKTIINRTDRAGAAESMVDDEAVAADTSTPQQHSVDKRAKEVIKKYLDAKDVDDVIVALKNIPATGQYFLVDRMLSAALKGGEPVVVLAEKLFATAYEQEACSAGEFERGFGPKVERVEDLSTEVPETYVWIVRLMYAAGMNRSQVEEMAGKILVFGRPQVKPRDRLMREFDRVSL